MAAVYWVGADGNVWVKGADGVQNMGKYLGGNDAGYDSAMQSGLATRIADPNPPQEPTPTAPSGGSSVAAKPDKSRDIQLQNAGIAALDEKTDSGMAAISKALSKLQGRYQEEADANEGNYNTQSTTNNQNLQKNKQTSLVNAAQGRQGLFGTLSSLGALSGSGIDLANRAVQQGANLDLSGAQDTFDENQTGLNTAIETFRRQNKMRNDDAEEAAEGARTNLRNDTATKKQQFYTNLSDDYSAMGDDANAQKYADLASALFPSIAKTAVPNSNIAYTAAAFTPGTLANYLAGDNNMQVSATPAAGGVNLPGLVATSGQKRKQQATV